MEQESEYKSHIIERKTIHVREIMPMMDYSAKLYSVYGTTLRNPRVQFDIEEIKFLAKDMARRGQLVPCVVMDLPETIAASSTPFLYGMIDGERRRRAAIAANIENLNCEILGSEYTPLELHEIIFDIERHKVPWTDVEKGIAIWNYIVDRINFDKAGDSESIWRHNPKLRDHYTEEAALAFGIVDTTVRHYLKKYRAILSRGGTAKRAILGTDIPGGMTYMAMSMVDECAKVYGWNEAKTREALDVAAKMKLSSHEWKVLRNIILPIIPNISKPKELFELAQKEAKEYRRLDILIPTDLHNSLRREAERKEKALGKYILELLSL